MAAAGQRHSQKARPRSGQGPNSDNNCMLGYDRLQRKGQGREMGRGVMHADPQGAFLHSAHTVLVIRVTILEPTPNHQPHKTPHARAKSL